MILFCHYSNLFTNYITLYLSNNQNDVPEMSSNYASQMVQISSVVLGWDVTYCIPSSTDDWITELVTDLECFYPPQACLRAERTTDYLLDTFFFGLGKTITWIKDI